MPTPTYDPIASTTLGSSASSVTFSSLNTIAAGYRDLVLVAQYTNASGNYSYIRLNSDTGFNYPMVSMKGDGSSATSATPNSTGFVDVPSGTSTGGTWIGQIFDFAQTDKHKSVLVRFDAAGSQTVALAGRWANTSAVTTITFVAGASNFLSGSTFSLFGVAA